MKTIGKFLLLITILFLFENASAQFVEDALRFSQFNSTVGARSQAMGNVVVGLADDYSALFGNPAGLSTQKSHEFTIGLSHYGYGNDVSYLGTITNDKVRVLNLDNLGIVWPIPTVRGGLTFAFGFGRVANYTSIASFNGYNPNSSLAFSDELWSLELSDYFLWDLKLADSLGVILKDNVQQKVKVRETGGLNNWSLGGGIDVAPELSFGVTLNYVAGTYAYDRVFTESDSRNLHYSYPDDLDYWTYTSGFECNINGFNALFALMLRRDEKFRAGLTIRTPTYYDISEVSYNEGSSVFDDGDLFSVGPYESRREYKVITPYIISGGASLRPNDWLLLAGDAEYVDWTQMEFDADNANLWGDLQKENRNIKELMRDTWNLRGGAEATICWKWNLKLRGGIEWKPSPWKDDPSSYDQWKYTGGIGYVIDENSSINISYALGSWKTFRYNYYIYDRPESKTSEKISTKTINITFSHKF